MSLTPDAESLFHYLEPLLDRYIEDLRQLCAIECPTSFKPGVDEAADWVERWARPGWEVTRFPDEVSGDSLMVTVRGAGTRSALLAAHLDTVYPVGLAAERPLMTVDGKLIGPGSADNKSGLLSGLYAMASLDDLGWLEHFAAVTLVCGSDEEKEMRCSKAVLAAAAPSCQLALVLEAGRENGDIVSARKGIGGFTLETRGGAAHAGVEPHRGANAILALAHQVIALQGLNGIREGTTVNVGVIQGGTETNVVPDRAVAQVDVRILRAEDAAPVEEAIAAIAARTEVPGAHTELRGGWHFRPMDKTPEIAAVAQLAADAAAELGFSVRDASTGGVSYANFLADLGLPVLDGLGPIGGKDHSPDEYITIDSIVPRTALLTLLLRRWATPAPAPYRQ